jgi:hypothetical protein
MYNKDIYNKLLNEFGEENMVMVTDIIATMYDIKYNAINHLDALSEFDYERDWWMSKHKELINLKEVIE